VLESFSPPVHHRAGGGLLQCHLVDKEQILKICDENQLQPSVFYQWLRQKHGNVIIAFYDGSPSRDAIASRS